MRKQVVRGTTMMLLLAALVLVTAVASANAQTARATANVPFEFVVGSKTLPAAHYTISDMTSGSQVVKISAREENANLFATTIPLSRKASDDKGKLVFHRYGNRYFLAEIWSPGERQGQKLKKSQEEKSIENEMAIISSKTDSVARTFERVEIALGRN